MRNEALKSYSKHATLSNGQHVAIYFTRFYQQKTQTIFNPKTQNIKFIENGEKQRFWSVYLCIDNSRRKCNDWFRKNSKQKLLRSTGKCGLEGLSNALNWVIELQDKISIGDTIIVSWPNEKRYQAYRYLLRLGFTIDCMGVDEFFMWQKS